MASVFSKAISAVLVPLLGCIVCPQAGAQGFPDQSIEFLETLEIADTLADQEEREISIPKPDTTTLVPFDDLMVANLMVATISKTSIVSPDRPTLMRDSIADRKALRKTVRLIKSERPRYPRAARREGWEGTVVLRIAINSGGAVEKVKTQESSGFPALDESATESVKTWRFDPAKDGEFPVPSTVDLPIRFDLEAYEIQSSRGEPEPEPEPVREQKPARLIKSERPDYPQTARQQGWEGTVVLRITVGTGGNVEKVAIQESSGFPELDESAAQSAQTWEFDPAKDGEDPISSAVDLPVRFDLEEYENQ